MSSTPKPILAASSTVATSEGNIDSPRSSRPKLKNCPDITSVSLVLEN